MGEGTKAYYEGFEDYGVLYDTGFWRQYRREAGRLLAAALPARTGLRVLDLGGGALLSLRELHADPRVSEYVVVDLVVKLPAGLPKVAATQSDILSYLRAYSGPPFDAVIIFGVLEYLKPADAEEVLRLVPGCLSPEGRVLVHEPNARAAAYMTRGQGEQRTVELESLLSGSGLALIERRDYHLPRVRAVCAKLGLRSPALLRMGLALERLLGGGADSLYLLKRDSV
ncbi:MAG: methyltransferase domain-containing protein [Elusimicrobia bacterium]|nr:methyltransferase domain-containing protein [Elusimicrobiota bacterium]